MRRYNIYACGLLLVTLPVILFPLSIYWLDYEQQPYTKAVALTEEEQRSQSSAKKTNGKSFEDFVEALKEKSLYPQMPQENRPFKHEYGNIWSEMHKWEDKWRPANDSFRYFQPVDDNDIWVYSAFYDDDAMVASHGKRSVRIIGLAERNSTVLNISCIIHTEDGQTHNSSGWITFPMTFWKPRVGAIVLQCPHRAKLPPIAVSVSTTAESRSTNLLQVVHPQHRQRNFTVCHAALHSRFDETSQLIQSMELNKILGAEHFMIYNLSISTKTDQILRYYEKKGELTVFQWPLPTLEPVYVGQLAAINDCIYRNRIKSKYVVVVDTDEIIFPHQADNWTDMMNSLENGYGWLKNPQYDQHNCNMPGDKLSLAPTNLSKPIALVDSYIFRTTFFLNKAFNVSTMNETLISKYGLRALKNFQRHTVLGHDIRTKYIARPDYIDAYGDVLFVVRRTNETIPAYVKCEFALIHHYRRVDLGGSTKLFLDYTALRVKDALLQNVQKVRKDLHW